MLPSRKDSRDNLGNRQVLEKHMRPHMRNFRMWTTMLLLEPGKLSQSFPHRCPLHRPPPIFSMWGACVLCAMLGTRERDWYHHHPLGEFQRGCVPGTLSWRVEGLFHMEAVLGSVSLSSFIVC